MKRREVEEEELERRAGEKLRLLEERHCRSIAGVVSLNEAFRAAVDRLA